MERAYFDMDLIRLSVEDGAVHLDKEFILIDNIYRGAKLTNVDTYFVNYPIKPSFIIVFFCLTGNMRFQINLQEYELHSNDILVIHNGMIGEYHGMSDNTKFIVIAFAPEFLQISHQIEATMSLQRRFYVSPLYHLNEKSARDFTTIYQLMKAKIKETDNPFRKGVLLGYMQILIYDAYNYLLKSETDSGKPKEKIGRQQELYTQFIKEVQKNYTKERSISYYADVLCVTPKYLSQIVHKVSGRFASDWITDYVILEAKALLKSKKYTVQQIADILNFANQSFFGKYFKKK